MCLTQASAQHAETSLCVAYCQGWHRITVFCLAGWRAVCIKASRLNECQVDVKLAACCACYCLLIFVSDRNLRSFLLPHEFQHIYLLPLEGKRMPKERTCGGGSPSLPKAPRP